MAKGVKTGGRVKGTPNKTTVAVKEALQATFDGIGGVPAMITWATENPTPFYNLYGKLLPIEANIQGEVDVGVTVQIVRMGDVSSS